jgi:hypothetical protein
MFPISTLLWGTGFVSAAWLMMLAARRTTDRVWRPVMFIFSSITFVSGLGCIGIALVFVALRSKH